MPRIGRFPPFGKRFFRRARKLIGSCHFAHFWRAVVSLAAMQGRRSMRKLEAACRNHHTRQSIGFFLTKAHWDAPELLTETALDTLKSLGWKSGDPLHVVFDDTQKRKRGKRMDAVSKIFLHAEKVYAQATRSWAATCLSRRGDSLRGASVGEPRLCQKTHEPAYDGDPIEFRKLTELAADIIAGMPLPNVTVLFDSYYLCPNVTRACASQAVSLRRRGQEESQLLPRWPRSRQAQAGLLRGQCLKRLGNWTSHEGKKYRLAERVGRLSKLGRVKLVFSRRAKEKSWIAMATNETRWGALRVLRHYLNRWPIEVLFKESKQYLGLGDYQMLRYRGIERYLHLVLIAHLLLTHLGGVAQGAQAARQKQTARLTQRASIATTVARETLGRHYQQHGKRETQSKARQETKASYPAGNVIAFSV